MNELNSLVQAPPAAVNHVFVDFENVKEVDFRILSSKPSTLTIIAGANQTKMNTGMVEEMMKHADSVQLIRLESSGKDAVDFTVAFYLGRKAVTDPGAHYHIVSKDTGFDPLIGHLKSRQIKVKRHDGFSSLLSGAPGKAASRPVAHPVDRIKEMLRRSPKNRPGKETTLLRYVRHALGTEGTDKTAGEIVGAMKKDGTVKVYENQAVTYHFS